ncbi:Phospholipase/carboxylesterase [Backusella circina FSU 941]|nr:Phospholipase/carboxylesterase [Backusella circina FSU 941]
MGKDKTAVVVEATEKHTATVIWLHGMGDTGIGWLFMTEELAPRFPFIKWILPNAPLREVSFDKGVTIPAWFDVNSFDKSAHLDKIDEKGMLESVDTVNQLVQREIDHGIPSDRIIVGGFSQGCVISLLTAVSTPFSLSAVIACSGWLALGEKLDSFGSESNKKIPILICHGEEDEVVRFKYGSATARYLKKRGYNVEFKGYPELGHASEPQELEDISNFIKSRLLGPEVNTSKL